MYGYIYKTTFLNDGKIYIGKHKSQQFVGKRYLGSGKIITSLIKKYGKERFTIECLCECYSKQELNDKESYYINKFNSRNRDIGYNISIGGDGEGIPGHAPTFTGPHTEESKEKNRKATREWNLSRDEESYAKVSNHHKGSKIMTNGTEQKWVWKDEIEQYEKDGWWIGSCKKRNGDYSYMRGEDNPVHNTESNACPIGKKWLHKYIDGKLVRKYVKEKYVEYYRQQGYELGMK